MKTLHRSSGRSEQTQYSSKFLCNLRFYFRQISTTALTSFQYHSYFSNTPANSSAYFSNSSIWQQEGSSGMSVLQGNHIWRGRNVEDAYNADAHWWVELLVWEMYCLVSRLSSSLVGMILWCMLFPLRKAIWELRADCGRTWTRTWIVPKALNPQLQTWSCGWAYDRHSTERIRSAVSFNTALHRKSLRGTHWRYCRIQLSSTSGDVARSGCESLTLRNGVWWGARLGGCF